MGTEWVAVPWLGLPVGVWGIASGYAVLALTRAKPLNMPKLARPNFGAAASAASSLVNRFRRAGGVAPGATAAAARAGSERRSGSLVVRIGLDLPADERELVLEAASRLNPYDGVRFEWITVNDNAAEHAAAPRTRRWSDRLRTCEATLRRTPGPRGKTSLEVVGSPHGPGSAWLDWGKPEEFSYAGVFPTRLDPAAVSFGNARVDHDCAPALVRMTASAAALRRTAAFGTSGGVGLNASPAERAADDMILDALRWAAGASGAEGAAGGNAAAGGSVRRVAARVGAAWIVGRGLAVGPAERVRLVNAAAGILSREPQVVLQSLASAVAAAASGCGGGGGGGEGGQRSDPAEADRAMTEAVERLLQLDQRATVDPFPFVMSELEHGAGDALTLGRIAAGAAMLWSGARGSSMSFLREDLLSDIEHTGWLRQRPPMRALLTRLVRCADRVRNQWDAEHSSRRAA